MQRTWQGAALLLVLAVMLVPATAWSDDAVPVAPAVEEKPGEGLCSLTPEPIHLIPPPPNEPSGGPCQVQFTCPSPAPGVLGKVIACYGDLYCLKNQPYWVECDYSRIWCND